MVLAGMRPSSISYKGCRCWWKESRWVGIWAELWLNWTLLKSETCRIGLREYRICVNHCKPNTGLPCWHQWTWAHNARLKSLILELLDNQTFHGSDKDAEGGQRTQNKALFLVNCIFAEVCRVLANLIAIVLMVHTFSFLFLGGWTWIMKPIYLSHQISLVHCVQHFLLDTEVFWGSFLILYWSYKHHMIWPHQSSAHPVMCNSAAEVWPPALPFLLQCILAETDFEE